LPAEFEDFFPCDSDNAGSTYLQRNGGVMSYNPKDTSKYGRMIRELAIEIKKKMEEGATEAKKEPALIGAGIRLESRVGDGQLRSSCTDFVPQAQNLSGWNEVEAG